jgi:hypothetical protein
MPIPAIDFHDMGNRCFVWKGESSAHGYLMRLGVPKVKPEESIAS